MEIQLNGERVKNKVTCRDGDPGSSFHKEYTERISCPTSFSVPGMAIVHGAGSLATRVESPEKQVPGCTTRCTQRVENKIKKIGLTNPCLSGSWYLIVFYVVYSLEDGSVSSAVLHLSNQLLLKVTEFNIQRKCILNLFFGLKINPSCSVHCIHRIVFLFSVCRMDLNNSREVINL